MEEREIIENCRLGRPGSDRALVEAYGRLVMSVALNILGSREDAEDVCQETFLQVIRRLDRYDGSRSFKTWLLAIASRRAIDILRKRRRFLAFASRSRQEAAASRSANPVPFERELPSALLKALSPRERAAVALWANEDMAAKDIAEVLGCSASTVRVTLFNARRKIKTLLEKDHGPLPPG